MNKSNLLAALAATMVLGGCGMPASDNTANNNNGNLGAAVGGVLANAGNGGDLISSGISILSAILGGNQLNKNTIVGTWTYAQPQVSFESNNVLAQLGGEVMGNKIEKALGTQLEKLGLKPGVSKFTFDNNGNVTFNLGSKTTTGTYQLNGNTLTMTGALGITKLTSTVTISAGQLYMLFDANALFSVITKLGTSSANINSLLKNYNGMKMGWSMTR